MFNIGCSWNLFQGLLALCSLNFAVFFSRSVRGVLKLCETKCWQCSQNWLAIFFHCNWNGFWYTYIYIYDMSQVFIVVLRCCFVEFFSLYELFMNLGAYTVAWGLLCLPYKMGCWHRKEETCSNLSKRLCTAFAPAHKSKHARSLLKAETLQTKNLDSIGTLRNTCKYPCKQAQSSTQLPCICIRTPSTKQGMLSQKTDSKETYELHEKNSLRAQQLTRQCQHIW